MTEAIATGGDLMPLVKALETQEQRRKELEARLDAISRPHPASDPAAVRRQLVRYLQDWRGFLRANVQQGQQALRRLIAGRLAFIPNEKETPTSSTGSERYARSSARSVRMLASPDGTRHSLPRFLFHFQARLLPEQRRILPLRRLGSPDPRS
jgi:hypothetical protein